MSDKEMRDMEDRSDVSDKRLDLLETAIERVDFLSARLDRSEQHVATVAAVSLPREHFKRRFRQMVLVAIVVSGLFWVMNNAVITKCFLTPAQTGWTTQTCAALYPGYKDARNQSEQNLKQFHALIANVPTNTQRVETLEQQVREIQAKETTK